MKKILNIYLILLMMSACTSSPWQYPQARKVDQTDDYFGEKVKDPYRWLENDTASEVRDWINAENEVTNHYLGEIPYRAKIREELTRSWNYERRTAPFKEGGRYFYWKNDGLQNQSVLYMTPMLSAEPVVLLDPNTLSKDGTVAVSLFSVSKDGKYAAYGLSAGGSDWIEIHIRDLATGKDLPDLLQWVKFSGASWCGNGFYYSRYDEPGKGAELTNQNASQKVCFHRVGTSQSEDKLIFENTKEPSRMYGAWVSDDQKWLVLYESDWSKKGNAVWVQDLTKPGSDLVCVAPGLDFDQSVAGIFKGVMYLLTNEDAPRNRLVTLDLTNLQKTEKKLLIPEQPDVMHCTMAGGKIVVSLLHDVKSILEIYSLAGMKERSLELPAIGSVDDFSGELDQDEAFFTFSSFNFPPTVYRYVMSTGARETWFSPKVNFNPDDYEVLQEFYESKDGSRIPMFIVFKKGLKQDGNNPAWLYGYGGFNITMNPFFSVSRLLWLENGGVFAVANIRGGGEYGEAWHEAGTKLKKQNVFDDFIASAEYLISRKYTNSKKLVIQGGSNGGLLIGAVINQRPDLFRVALPAVGVMDMLRFQKFTIGAAWTNDYGSSDDPEQFKYLYAYSPLHNIRSGLDYPAVLVTTADHDDRVVPAHSFKYIATLQEKYKGKNPVMIRIQTQAGHGAGKPTSMAIDELTDIYAFVFRNLDMTPH